jgi:nanoRNase/pAp phosphatase (c-di-AMP/oligoRNAs hydrolase)
MAKRSTKRSAQRSWRQQAETLLKVFQPNDDVSVFIKPDPDSMASAYALKRLLWRKVRNTSIVCLNQVQRLDNLAMKELLKIPLMQMAEVDTDAFTRYVLVDAQPDHDPAFSDLPFDVIIDHHPIKRKWKDSALVDIRPTYGATATILLEYLRGAKIKPSMKLATALLYAIKTDTRNFERAGAEEDVIQFQYIFNHANRNLLTKIDRSELTPDDLDYFETALNNRILSRKRLYTHVGKVPRSDICVQVADFLTKVHGVGWIFVSGVHEEKLIVIFRNDGYRKDAGKTAIRAFGDLGSGGGHKGAARAEIPLDVLRENGVKAYSSELMQYVKRRLKF